jgi:hypothetical protein
MNDMMFLQNKKLELQKQEEENQRKVAEFARMKMLLEQNNKMPNMNGTNGTNGMNNMNGTNGMSGMNGMNGISNISMMPEPASGGNMNERYEELRRKNINEHLQSIKDKVKNIDIRDNIDDEPLYLRAMNAKAREPYNNKNQINNKDDTDRSTSSSSKNSTESSKTSSSEDTSSKRKSEKSVSTTLSKRKYNKKGITIQTN